MSCVLHVLFWCQIREGTFLDYGWQQTGIFILLRHKTGTQKTYIPKLMETVLWDQSFKCSSQHGANYLKVFFNLGPDLPMPLFLPLVILTCHTEILRINVLKFVKCQKYF